MKLVVRKNLVLSSNGKAFGFADNKEAKQFIKDTELAFAMNAKLGNGFPEKFKEAFTFFKTL